MTRLGAGRTVDHSDHYRSMLRQLQEAPTHVSRVTVHHE